MPDKGGSSQNTGGNTSRFFVIFGATLAALLTAMVACTAFVGGLSWLGRNARIKEVCEAGVSDPRGHLLQMKMAGMEVPDQLEFNVNSLLNVGRAFDAQTLVMQHLQEVCQ